LKTNNMNMHLTSIRKQSN